MPDHDLVPEERHMRLEITISPDGVLAVFCEPRTAVLGVLAHPLPDDGSEITDPAGTVWCKLRVRPGAYNVAGAHLAIALTSLTTALRAPEQGDRAEQRLHVRRAVAHALGALTLLAGDA
jgi:hypothetical protein